MINFSKSVKVIKLFSYNLHKHQIYDLELSIPYSSHLLEVASIIVKFADSYNDNTLKAAFLHDSIEDIKNITKIIISKKTNLFVAEIVYLVTDENGHNRKTRKLKTNKKLSEVKNIFWDALTVKSADRYSNMLYSFKTNNKNKMKMYFKEYHDFRKAVFRKGHNKLLWNKLDNLYNDIGHKLNKF
jgi:hypothetical protein